MSKFFWFLFVRIQILVYLFSHLNVARLYRGSFLVLYPFIYFLYQLHQLLPFCVFWFFTFGAIRAQNMCLWLPIMLVRLSNDVHLNLGHHFQNSFFNFMSWNVNSLAEDNFNRFRHIEAHNSIFNYDLISICEKMIQWNY